MFLTRLMQMLSQSLLQQNGSWAHTSRTQSLPLPKLHDVLSSGNPLEHSECTQQLAIGACVQPVVGEQPS